MKNIVTVLLLIASSSLFAQDNVGIGTSVPDASAALEIKSPDQGVLVPRMGTVARNAIVSPANGLLVYDLNTRSFWYHKQGLGWTEISQGDHAWTDHSNGAYYNGGNIGVPLAPTTLDQVSIDSRSTANTNTYGLTIRSKPSQTALQVQNATGTALRSNGESYFTGNMGIGTSPTTSKLVHIKAASTTADDALFTEFIGPNKKALHAKNSNSSGHAAYFDGKTEVRTGDFFVQRRSFLGDAVGTATLNVKNLAGQQVAINASTNAAGGAAIEASASHVNGLAGSFSGPTLFGNGSIILLDTTAKLVRSKIEFTDGSDEAQIRFDGPNERVIIDSDILQSTSLAGAGYRNVIAAPNGDLVLGSFEYDTSFVMIHAADFVAYEDAGDEFEYIDCMARSNGDIGNYGKIVAAIHVPHKSEIISMNCNFFDDDNGSYIKFYHENVYFAGSGCDSSPLLFHQSSSSNTDSNVQSGYYYPTTPILVNNATAKHTIMVESDGWGSDVNVGCVVIGYRVLRD